MIVGFHGRRLLTAFGLTILLTLLALMVGFRAVLGVVNEATRPYSVYGAEVRTSCPPGPA